jgi:hypothetical protein
MFFKDGMGFMWDISANISSPGVVRVYRAGGGGLRPPSSLYVCYYYKR